MLSLTLENLRGYGYENEVALLSAVAEYAEAKRQHAFTEGVAAPVAPDALVERLYQTPDDEWEVLPPLPPSPSPPAPRVPTLQEAKSLAAATVDRLAEDARMLYLTPGPGQALEYMETESEARRYKDDLKPDDLQYPMLLAEQFAYSQIGQTVSLNDVVADVLSQANAWVQVGSIIKGKRLAAKLKIREAKTKEQITEVLMALEFGVD